MLPTRFVTNAALELLARRLRVLGYDVASHAGARLEELFAAAARDGRTVLTTSARHPRRFAAVPVVRAVGRPADAVRAIAAAHAPAGAPWSRCPACNHVLRAAAAVEARGEVPGRVLREAGPLRHCPGCGRWYWPGSHVARLMAWLEAALGRALTPPGEGGGPPPA